MTNDNIQDYSHINIENVSQFKDYLQFYVGQLEASAPDPSEESSEAFQALTDADFNTDCIGQYKEESSNLIMIIIAIYLKKHTLL